MILRKPYAFLIKNFRIIHFILSLIIGYIIFRTSSILSFLNNYIQRGYFNQTLSLTRQYTDVYLFLSIFIVILITIIIYFLMRFKNKPRLFYFITIIVYMIAFIIFIQAYFNLQVMETAVIDPRAIRLTRDMILIFSLAQYFIIGNTLFTATGFNIKKFGFQEDLEELDIAAADAEEFEFILGFDFEQFKVNLRRKLRHTRYVFIENKYVMLTVMAILAILIGTYYIINTQVLNKVYQEGQSFKTDKYDLNITNSYITNKDYQGNNISKVYSYVIVKLDVKNLTTKPHELATSTMILKIDDEKYYIRGDSDTLFKDLGISHIHKTLIPNIKKTYIVVFRIDQNLITKPMTLDVVDSFIGNDITYKTVRLNPKDLDKSSLVKTVKLNNELSFKNTILGDTKLTITSIDIKDEFIYKYQLCIMKECHEMADYVLANTMTRYDTTLLKLDLNFKLDKKINSEIPKDAYDLIYYFGTIRYYKDGKMTIHSAKLNNMTPKYYKDGIFIDVLKDIKSADKIDILFKIRDKEYVYIIKEA